MLKHEPEFPQVGSRGFIAETGEPARIIQRRLDGRLLVSITEGRVWQDGKAIFRQASSRTIDADQIAETIELACPPRQPRRMGKPVVARAGAA